MYLLFNQINKNYYQQKKTIFKFIVKNRHLHFKILNIKKKNAACGKTAK